MGGMNCKIDDLINGSTEEISNRGMIMIKMIKEHTQRKTKTVMTNQAYIKYKEMLQNGRVSKLLEISLPQQN